MTWRIKDGFYSLFHFLIFLSWANTILKSRKKTINLFQKGNKILRDLTSLWPSERFLTWLSWSTQLGAPPLTWTAQPSHHDFFTNSGRVPPRPCAVLTLPVGHARAWLTQVYAGHGAGSGNGYVPSQAMAMSSWECWNQNPLVIVTSSLPNSPPLSHSLVIPSHMCHRVLPCALLACPGMCLLSLTSVPSPFPSPQPSTLPTTHLPPSADVYHPQSPDRGTDFFLTSTVWVFQEH